jgi:hypothetical protein
LEEMCINILYNISKIQLEWRPEFASHQLLLSDLDLSSALPGKSIHFPKNPLLLFMRRSYHN